MAGRCRRGSVQQRHTVAAMPLPVTAAMSVDWKPHFKCMLMLGVLSLSLFRLQLEVILSAMGLLLFRCFPVSWACCTH